MTAGLPQICRDALQRAINSEPIAEAEFRASKAESLMLSETFHYSAVSVVSAGSRARAPRWMQHAGLEWAWRIWLEPRRLFWRYLTTNPRALYLLLNKGRSTDIGGTHNR